MKILRKITALVLVLSGIAALGGAVWIAYNFTVPEDTGIHFNEAEAIHKSVYGDTSISKLLEQNLRMQEAIFSAQKEGVGILYRQTQGINISNNMLIQIVILIGASIFFLMSAFFVYPRKVQLDRNSLAQLEMILWASWVAEKDKGDKEGFTVQESTYPVHLCGCSSEAGVPVHLCGCKSDAYPVPLCGCSDGYLDKCRRVPPVHLCECGKT